jgi:hypothetical protein
MIDCACVITGDKYDFDYVHKLYNGLTRGFSQPITLHIYTEHFREVPPPYVKHAIEPIKTRHGKGWWNKVQLFNPRYFSGQLIYFDLDIVITGNLDWMLGLNTKYFWGIRDFRYLWNKRRHELNSSVMYFNTEKFRYVWKEFKRDPDMFMNRLHGDQNFIDKQIPTETKQFFDKMFVKSYKWELLDGGYNIETRRHRTPNSGTVIPHETSIAVFHGKPNPDEVIEKDKIIAKYWC